MGTLRVRKIAAIVGLAFGWLVLLLLHTWAILAIYFANYHHPFARTLLPIVYVLVLILLAVFVRRHILRLCLFLAAHFAFASRFRGLYLGHTLVDVHPTNWAR